MKYDSILFDMDGTLWDAVDSYAQVWNATINALCPGRVPHVDYSRLASMMGMPLNDIFDTLIGTAVNRDTFLTALYANEDAMMPVLGGAVYPHVRPVIEELAPTHKLIMVSNCTKDGLPNFLEYTHLKPFFTDAISFGDTGHEKDYNIALMIRKHDLKAPLYVGDTTGDCHSAHAAGVPFAWATYGFGRGVEGYEYALDSLNDLLKIVK